MHAAGGQPRTMLTLTVLFAQVACGAAFHLSAPSAAWASPAIRLGTGSPRVPGRALLLHAAASASPGATRRDVLKAGSAAAALLLATPAFAMDFAKVREQSHADAARARVCKVCRQAAENCDRQSLRPKFQATAIFGSDGDLPPSFAEQLAAKVGKAIDKNYIDTRRPPPVRCVWMPCDPRARACARPL
jgi:hypothetical protein